MASPKSVYQGSVRVLSALMVAVGAVIVAVTLINGGGPLSTGVVLGLAFAAVGVGRLLVARRMER